MSIKSETISPKLMAYIMELIHHPGDTTRDSYSYPTLMEFTSCYNHQIPTTEPDYLLTVYNSDICYEKYWIVELDGVPSLVRQTGYWGHHRGSVFILNGQCFEEGPLSHIGHLPLSKIKLLQPLDLTNYLH